MSVISDFVADFTAWEMIPRPDRGDREILRGLAAELAEAAATSANRELAELWNRHNRLERTRPLVLARPEGGWKELVPESALRCGDPRLREWETVLRRHVFRVRHIPDDWPLPRTFDIAWVVKWGDYGLKRDIQHSPVTGGAYRWLPSLQGPDDLRKLRFRTIEVDRSCTEYKLALANEIFGDLLPARIHGRLFVMLGLTEELAFLRGLQQVMLDLYDDPALIHEIMAFLRDAKMQELDFYAREGLLTLNNEAHDYIGQGGIGITDELPAAGFAGKVRLADLWGTEAAQEFSGVGPELFAEFVLPYQAPILKRFGLVSYGCCEPLDKKLAVIRREVPNLRRVSVSAWCDRAKAAEELTDRYLYAYKPNPATICGPEPHHDAAEQELRETMRIAKDCRLEVIMKDTHTFQNDPARITAWVQMAKRLALA